MTKDRKMAARWLQKAAQRGHVRAALVMAERHAGGDGVTRDDAEAYTFLRLHMALAGDKALSAEAAALKEDLERRLTPEQQAGARQKAEAQVATLKEKGGRAVD